MTTFKVPSVLPQDLLLIRDLVGEDKFFTPASATSENAPKVDQDSIESSSDGTDSEEEVEANLLATGNDPSADPLAETLPASSESESDNSSVSSDSDLERKDSKKKCAETAQYIIDDDDDAPTQGPAAYAKTLNEIVEDEIVIPDIQEVDPGEPLEKIGEILSILNDKIVIVKGIASSIADRGSDKALDSDTLLVFEDRKVMGFIYETFGPTYQPLYQIRFNEKFPLDRDRARVSGPVFHVPHRSKFVFVNQLKQQKGSDASNAHDEEPAEDEVEFSDDDQEAAYKRAKRTGRSESRESSVRLRTPRRQDHDFFDESLGSHNPYDEHGPYDMDYGAGPSRPSPIPYDDPYADPYTDVPTGEIPVSHEPSPKPLDSVANHDFETHPGSPSSFSTSHDRHPAPGFRPPRGRGRGRDRQGFDRGRRRGRGRGRDPSGTGSQHGARNIRQVQSAHSFSAQDQSTFPTHAMSDYPERSQTMPLPSVVQPAPVDTWSHPSPAFPQNFEFGFQSQYGNVQPHINPRFANQWGFDFGQMQAQYGSNASSSQWTGGQDDDMGQNGR